MAVSIAFIDKLSHKQVSLSLTFFSPQITTSRKFELRWNCGWVSQKIDELGQNLGWVRPKMGAELGVKYTKKTLALTLQTNPVLQRLCAILKRIGFVVVSTLSITKLLNQQETGCIQLGSKRSFLMRRRSVFHHIFPPNSKKVCCIWWKVERPIFVLVPLFSLPKRKHCKQPVS